MLLGNVGRYISARSCIFHKSETDGQWYSIILVLPYSSPLSPFFLWSLIHMFHNNADEFESTLSCDESQLIHNYTPFEFNCSAKGFSGSSFTCWILILCLDFSPSLLRIVGHQYPSSSIEKNYWDFPRIFGHTELQPYLAKFQPLAQVCFSATGDNIRLVYGGKQGNRGAEACLVSQII